MTTGRVKALEWRVFCSKSGNCEAVGTFGTYVIQHEDNEWQLFLPWSGDIEAKTLPTEAEAKAAAQSDYERRILSALSPTDSDLLEDMAKALETVIDGEPFDVIAYRALLTRYRATTDGRAAPSDEVA